MSLPIRKIRLAAAVSPQTPYHTLLALIAAAALCAVGVHFWNYLQSYQWTDDAEIDGHLIP